jgi:hypothetical protein
MNYLKVLAEKIKTEVPDEVIPKSPNLDSLFMIYAVLLLAKGVGTTKEDVHNAWAAWMTQSDDSHDSIKPFNELSIEIQGQDQPFVDAIHKVASTLA